eukprot:jgi/Tetstr1/466229/TSEL_010786.t1
MESSEPSEKAAEGAAGTAVPDLESAAQGERGGQQDHATPNKVSMEGFNRHVQQILDKVLDSPLPAEALNNAPVPARLAKAATADQDLATEMETEGQNPSLHYCKLCQVWISGDLNCQAHLAGRKHIKRYKLYQQVQHKAGVPRSQAEGELEVEGSNNATVPPGDSVPLADALAVGPKVCSSVLLPVSEADSSMVPLYKCNLCDITATSLDHLEAHYRGVKHQKRLALVAMKSGGEANAIMADTDDGKPICPGAAFHCTVCEITCSSLENLQTHCKGRKHMRRLMASQQQAGVVGDPMEAAMAAASASLAAMSIGRHAQKGGRRASDPSLALPEPQPHALQQPQLQPPHGMHPHVSGAMPVYMPQEAMYHMQPMMPHDMYAYHQMAHPAMAYVPGGVGPWPAPAHIHGPHHHHHHPHGYATSWMGQVAPVPPPPPPHYHPDHYHHQWQQPPQYCIVEEEQERDGDGATAREVVEGQDEHLTAGDLSSSSLGSVGSVVERASVQPGGGVGEFVEFCDIENAHDEDDELSLSSGRSTPVAFEAEGGFAVADMPASPEFSFRGKFQPRHRRGVSIDLGEVSLALTPSGLGDGSGRSAADSPVLTPSSRLLTHLSLDALAQQDLGRLSLSFDFSLGANGAPPRRVSGASSSEPVSERDDSKRVSDSSEHADAPSCKQSHLCPATDAHVPTSPYANLSPIGGSARPFRGGHHQQRPSSAGDEVITAPTRANPLSEIPGWSSGASAYFETRGMPVLLPASAAPHSPRARGHLRSQSLSVLGHDVAVDAGFTFASHHQLDSSSFGAGLASQAVSVVPRAAAHQRNASEAALSAPRPPLYKTVSASGPTSTAAKPPQAQAPAGLGIWTMTESDRKRSSSGSWESESMGPNGDDSADASLIAPSEPRVSDGSSAASVCVCEAPPTAAAPAPTSVFVGESAAPILLPEPIPSNSDNLAPGEPYFCSLCGVAATNAAHLEAHYAGKRHQRALAGLRAPGDGGVEGQAAAPSSGSSRFVCQVCNVACTSEIHLEVHFQGRQHKRKSAALVAAGGLSHHSFPNRGPSPFFCALCGVSATSSDHLASHFRGKQHVRKMRLAAEQATPPPPPPMQHPHWVMPAIASPEHAVEGCWMMPPPGACYVAPPHPVPHGWWQPDMTAGYHHMGVPDPQHWMMPVPMMQHRWHA